ncbi:DUF2019 domain-containing protein [Xanthobacteraceae bacterium A53D]
MKMSKRIPDFPSEDLVHSFLDLSLKMKRADDALDNGAYNRAHKKLRDIQDELQRRSGDQRALLLPLLAHPDVQVRLNAAVATLALSSEAEAAMRGIASLGYFSQAAAARGLLRSLDSGQWKPT